MDLRPKSALIGPSPSTKTKWGKSMVILSLYYMKKYNLEANIVFQGLLENKCFKSKRNFKITTCSPLDMKVDVFFNKVKES